MSIALDPSQTSEISLDNDADRPEAERPTFLARFLTCREARHVQDRLSSPDSDDPAKQDELLERVLAIQLAGWRNVADRDGKAIPFTVTDGRLVTAGDVVTPMERWELIAKCQTAIRLDEAKKKALRLQRLSAGASSATTAATKDDAAPQPLPTPTVRTTSPSPV
jgi:hypothetical protein